MKNANLPWTQLLREIPMLLSQKFKKKDFTQKDVIARKVDVSRNIVNVIKVG